MRETGIQMRVCKAAFPLPFFGFAHRKVCAIFGGIPVVKFMYLFEINDKLFDENEETLF